MPTSKGGEFAKSLGEDKALFTPVNVSFLPIFFYFFFKFGNICQVTSETDVINALEAAKQKFGTINNVVNCAGIGVAYKTYNFRKNVAHSLEDFVKVLTVSVYC